MLKRQEILNKYKDFLQGDGVNFSELALDIFRYQAKNNEVYQRFLKYLNTGIDRVDTISKIPFLPVSLYKKYEIKSGVWLEERVFESSSTTGLIPSKHYLRDLNFYLQNAKNIFEEAYGSLKDFCFMALLPSYLERNNSSLIFMVDYFIKESGCGKFYKNNYKELLDDIREFKGEKKIILIGVTYALLDMAKMLDESIPCIIIMETGGMKGRGKELPRKQVHNILQKCFGVEDIHSEYGMTELLSQSYSKGKGVFRTSSTMKVLFSDIYDPFFYVEAGKQGKINIIDLANIDTCSFISTDDLGRDLGNGKFEVLGRTDESDIRGCNLLFTG